MPKYFNVFTYYYVHLSIHVRNLYYRILPICFNIILRPYTPYTYLHNSTARFLYRFTYVYDHTPIHAFIIRRPHTPYTYLHTYTLIYLYKFTYFHANISMLIFSFLRQYTYTRLHTSTVIYLYIITFFYAHNRYMFTYIHLYVYILLRPYTNAC
jgi:hypothetical protein